MEIFEWNSDFYYIIDISLSPSKWLAKAIQSIINSWTSYWEHCWFTIDV